MGSMNALILSMKAFVVWAGVVSLAVAMKGIPMLWPTILSWPKPPYLFVIINGIIITIVALSRFHQNHSEPPVRSEHLISVKTSLQTDFVLLSAQRGINSTVVEDSTAVEAQEYEYADSKATYSTTSQEIISPELQLDYTLPVREKPLVSSRFIHRKPIKSNPKGAKAPRVARPKRQETVESTRKTMTAGGHVPLTRHHKKSDKQFPKPETIKDRSNYRKDELNRKVEAFIKKQKEHLRLEKQESLKRDKEMINGGA